jgi:hypothetical protein
MAPSTTARPSSFTPAKWASVTGLAQEQEPGLCGGEARGERGLGQRAMAMTERERKTVEKLPYTRKYLRAARFGLDALFDQKPIGPDHLFYVIGLLATLRACQHVLINRDRKLSPRHEEVIGLWRTKDHLKQVPELRFIAEARNTLLKDGSFPSHATRSEASWETDVVDYEMAHYLGGERRDFETDVRAAFDWFERQLAEIEAKLPPRYGDNKHNESDTYTPPISIPPQTIAGTMTTPAIEDSAVIKFARRPQPWRHGDVIEIFHKPSGRTTLTAIEHLGFVHNWKSETQRFHLERIDDYNYRIVQPA